MFDDLNEIIKSDSESQEKFKQFKVNFHRKREKKHSDEKRRGRLVAVILGTSAVISIVFLFYAFKAQTEADHYKVQVEQLTQELQECSEQ